MLADQPKPLLNALLSGVADIALVIDSENVLQEVTVWSPDLPAALAETWKGQALLSTLVPSEADDLPSLLDSIRDGGVNRCDLVHRIEGNELELPVDYHWQSTEDGELFAVGTDLRPAASLRQQLVNAQQALEQDYWRLRQVESRYQRLFDMVADGVMVVDATSMRVLEANPRAHELLASGERGVVGKVFPRGFDGDSTRAVQDLLAEIKAVGKGQLQNLRTDHSDAVRIDLAASFLRQAGEERFLLRLAERGGHAPVNEGGGVFLQEVVRSAPDAVVMTDDDGRIMAVNHSFLELAQLVAEEQVIGHSADRWIGRSGVDLNVLLSNLRDKSEVKLFSSTLVPQSGPSAQVEISACRLDEPDGPRFGLFIRDVERRVRDHPVKAQLPSSIDQVTQRVGRVPLKELVRESTDLIEALCIETALEVTQDNRASAAELLGLSRQSLYAKLRRFNIGTIGEDAAESD